MRTGQAAGVEGGAGGEQGTGCGGTAVRAQQAIGAWGAPNRAPDLGSIAPGLRRGCPDWRPAAHQLAPPHARSAPFTCRGPPQGNGCRRPPGWALPPLLACQAAPCARAPPGGLEPTQGPLNAHRGPALPREGVDHPLQDRPSQRPLACIGGAHSPAIFFSQPHLLLPDSSCARPGGQGPQRGPRSVGLAVHSWKWGRRAPWRNPGSGRMDGCSLGVGRLPGAELEQC